LKIRFRNNALQAIPESKQKLEPLEQRLRQMHAGAQKTRRFEPAGFEKGLRDQR